MNTLVHEEQYRGEELLKKMEEKAYVICGVGAIGSNLVNNMVRQGFKKISVIDFDRVDDHNRHTQLWGRRHIGQLKANMLKNIIYENMGVQIDTIPKKLEEGNLKKFLGQGSVIVDGFDNSESRALVAEYATKTGADCLHVGLYQDYAEIVWNEDYRVPKNVQAKDVCEYPLARNVILMAVAVATEVLIRHLDTGVKENYEITLKDFSIRKR